MIDPLKQKSFEQLVQKFELKGLVLYGSMVSSSEIAEDADVIYFRFKKLGYQDFGYLNDSISELLGKDKVDLVYWNDAYPLLKNEVTLKNEILAGDNEWIQTHLRAGQREYWDALPYYNALDEKLKQQLNVA
jgi:predicted nucleotidyltransferase